jgi:phosphoribosylamine--glycine ligase
MEKLNILLVGSGGREHALAWKIAQSPLCGRLVAAPGNPGIAQLAELRAVKVTDVAGLVALAREIAADLVVVGPESALEVGLADELAKAGIPCFGGSALAARLETSRPSPRTSAPVTACRRRPMACSPTRPRPGPSSTPWKRRS